MGGVFLYHQARTERTAAHTIISIINPIKSGSILSCSPINAKIAVGSKLGDDGGGAGGGHPHPIFINLHF
ncbi:MAG: hypothetical protein ACTSO9_11545 [Candidatus Helarchaeota archaeon]